MEAAAVAAIIVAVGILCIVVPVLVSKPTIFTKRFGVLILIFLPLVYSFISLCYSFKTSRVTMSKTASPDKKKRKSSGYQKSDDKSKHHQSDYNNKKQKKTLKPDAAASTEFRHPRKHAEDVEQAKRIWNQLRVKTNTTEENAEYMKQLMPLVQGKAPQVALQHDASRCVQACVQFGTPAERKELLKEFSKAGIADLSKNQYACFSVLKFIKYCHTDKECANLILKSFKGQVPKLSTHAVSSRVMNAVFESFSSKQTASLKQEFYGPHFALFAMDAEADATPPTLITNLAKAPNKKEQTLDFVRNIINKGMTKTLYGLGYFQELCAEYVAAVDPSEVRQMATTAADHSIHLLSSKHGVRVVAMLIAFGTAKDRKRIMKSFKGYTRSGLLHPDAYLAILRLVQLTDDTVSIQKNILNELITFPEAKVNLEKQSKDKDKEEGKVQDSPLLELALDKRASKLLLMVVMPPGEARDKLFDPYESSFLFPNPTVQEDGKEVPTSRKEPEVRRKELLEFMKEHLIELCCKHAKELLYSLSGAAVLREVYSAFRTDSLVTAVIDICKDDTKIFDDKIAHHSIRNMLLTDVLADDSPLAEAFLDQLSEQLMIVARSSRGAFVLAALCKVAAVRKKAKKAINEHIEDVKLLMNNTDTVAGYEALLKEIAD